MKNKLLILLKKTIIFLVVSGISFLILVMTIGGSDIINQDGFLSFLAVFTPFVVPIFLGFWAAKKISAPKHAGTDDSCTAAENSEETLTAMPIPKKPYYKRWWVWVLVIFVSFGSCFAQIAPILAPVESAPTSLMTTEATEQSETVTMPATTIVTVPTEATAAETPTAAGTPEPTKAVAATEPTTTEKIIETTYTTAPPETAPPTAETTTPLPTIEDAVAALDLILPEGFENYNISHDGNIITIGVWEQGVVDVIDVIAGGRIEYKPRWDTLVTSYISTNNSFCKLVKDMGIEDVSIVLNLLNDYDRVNILLSVVDGAVVYDCLADLPIPETEETRSAREQLGSIMATHNPAEFEKEWNYVLNTNTKKFHYTGCSSVSNIKPGNRRDVTATRGEVVTQGYEPCKRCSP